MKTVLFVVRLMNRSLDSTALRMTKKSNFLSFFCPFWAFLVIFFSFCAFCAFSRQSLYVLDRDPDVFFNPLVPFHFSLLPSAFLPSCRVKIGKKAQPKAHIPNDKIQKK